MKELINDLVSIVKKSKEEDEDFSIAVCIVNVLMTLISYSMITTTTNIIVEMVHSGGGSFITTVMMIIFACATLTVLFSYVVSLIMLLADVVLTLRK